jgi:indolepyruvate ferredoxin oxidoreductase beta subunit
MKLDLVIAGIQGQGVRTAAAVLEAAARRAGLHAAAIVATGHLQREDAVAVHLRIGTHPVPDSPIGLGQADLILALEPLESMRHIQLLSAAGTVLTTSEPAAGLASYPPLDELLLSILRLPSGYLLDARRLATAAGDARLVNAVLLGAATAFLPLERTQLREALAEFARGLGATALTDNLAAFDAGCDALHHREMVDEFDTFAAAGH